MSLSAERENEYESAVIHRSKYMNTQRLRVGAHWRQGPQNFARRDLLLTIQAESQKRWTDERVFEADAPAEGALHARTSSSAAHAAIS